MEGILCGVGMKSQGMRGSLPPRASGPGGPQRGSLSAACPQPQLCWHGGKRGYLFIWQIYRHGHDDGETDFSKKLLSNSSYLKYLQ